MGKSSLFTIAKEISMRISDGVPPVNPYSAKYQSVSSSSVPAPVSTQSGDSPAVTLTLSATAMSLMKAAMEAPKDLLKLLE